jgi:hypothetical protein
MCRISAVHTPYARPFVLAAALDARVSLSMSSAPAARPLATGQLHCCS